MQIAKYFIDSPLLSLLLAALAGCGWYGAILLSLHHSLGNPAHLRRLTALWSFNCLWEWSRFLKLYALKWDVRVIYPLLFFLSVLLIVVWVISIIRDLREKEDPKEREVVKAAAYSGYSLLLLLAPQQYEKAAREQPLLLGIPPLLFSLLASIVSLFTHGTFFEFSRHFGIGALFGGGLLAAGYVLNRLRGFEDKKGGLRLTVETRAREIETQVEALEQRVHEFERLALEKFHAITGEANHEFAAAKRIYDRLKSRLDAIATLFEEGGEAEIIAAEKLLNTELDVRDNFVDGIISAGQTTHLMPKDWDTAIQKRIRAMDIVLTSIRDK